MIELRHLSARDVNCLSVSDGNHALAVLNCNDDQSDDDGDNGEHRVFEISIFITVR